MIPPCPKIGQLIRLKHYSPTSDRLWVESVTDATEVEVMNGTIALVIGIYNRGKKGHKGPVPIILVNGITGWIFRDEWEPLE